MKYINGVSEESVFNNSLYKLHYRSGEHIYTTIVDGKYLYTIQEEHLAEIESYEWLDFDAQPTELLPFFEWYKEHEYKVKDLSVHEIFEQYGEEI